MVDDTLEKGIEALGSVINAVRTFLAVSLGLIAGLFLSNLSLSTQLAGSQLPSSPVSQETSSPVQPLNLFREQRFRLTIARDYSTMRRKRGGRLPGNQIMCNAPNWIPVILMHQKSSVNWAVSVHTRKNFFICLHALEDARFKTGLHWNRSGRNYGKAATVKQLKMRGWGIANRL